MSIESLQGEIEALMSEIQGWVDVQFLPDNLRDAISAEWSMVDDLAVSELITRGGEAAGEKTRVMSMATAQRLLSDFEETLVKEMTLGTGEVVWRKVTAYKRMIENLIRNRESIWEFVTSIDSLEELLVWSVKEAALVLALASIKKTIDVGRAELPGAERRMKSACFPQSSGPRFRVRKATRQ